MPHNAIRLPLSLNFEFSVFFLKFLFFLFSCGEDREQWPWPWATVTARGEISIMSDQVRDFSPCSVVNSLTPVEPQRTETHHHIRPPVADRHGHPPWANFPSWRVEPVRVRKSSRCFLEGFDWHLRSVVAGEVYGVYQSVPKCTKVHQSVPNENSFVFYARVPQPWSFVGLSAGPGMFLGFLRLASG